VYVVQEKAYTVTDKHQTAERWHLENNDKATTQPRIIKCC